MLKRTIISAFVLLIFINGIASIQETAPEMVKNAWEDAKTFSKEKWQLVENESDDMWQKTKAFSKDKWSTVKGGARFVISIFGLGL